MPRDLFAESGINPNEPRDLLSEQNTQRQEMAQQQMPMGQPQQPSRLERLASSSAVNSILGAGDEMARIWSAGVLHPKFGEGAVYEASKIPGAALAYMAPGSLLKTAAAAGGLGEIGASIGSGKGIPAIAGRIAGGGAFGAAESPGDRITGLVHGLLAGTVGEGLPYAKVGLSKVSEAVRPQKYVNSLASKVEDTLGMHEDVTSQAYKNIFSRTKDKSIYGKTISYELKEPEGSQAYAFPKPVKGAEYLSLPINDVKTAFTDKKLKDLNKVFFDNPTFENAHLLKRGIGDKIRSLDRKAAANNGYLEAHDQVVYDSINFAKEKLNNDMMSYADKHPDKTIKGDYLGAQNYFRKHVVPNREASNFFTELGENPEPEKVSDQFKKIKIREAKLQKANPGAKLIPEYLHEDIGDLEKKIAGRNIARVAGGGAAGYTLGHLLGFPLSGELSAAVAGGGLAPQIGKLFKGRNPTTMSFETPSLIKNLRKAVRPSAVTSLTEGLNKYFDTED
jgi:hypothetical protein